MRSAEPPFMTESGVSLDVKKVIAVDAAASNHKTDDASTDDPKLAIIEEIIGGTSSAEIGAKPVDDNNPSSTGNDASNDDPNLVLSDEKSIGKVEFRTQREFYVDAIVQKEKKIKSDKEFSKEVLILELKKLYRYKDIYHDWYDSIKKAYR